jgi:hypothetical protein
VNIKIEDDDGGPVFPGSDVTLRDWFAGQALAGMLSNVERDKMFKIDVAFNTYEYADAMLAARRESK